MRCELSGELRFVRANHLPVERGGLCVAAPRVAVDMDGARAALCDAATVLGTGQARLLAQHPQEGGVALHINLLGATVDVELDHGRFSYLEHVFDIKNTMSCPKTMIKIVKRKIVLRDRLRMRDDTP